MGGTRGDASSDPEDEVAQRKKRGRLAQRAFRQRQIDTIAKLEARNNELQEAIAAVTRAAASVENPELSEAVKNALHVAGLDQAARSPGSRAGRKSAERHGTAAGQAPDMRATPSRSAPEKVSQASQALVPRETRAPDWLAHTPHHETPSLENPGYRTGRMSPRLGHGGLWLEPQTIHVVYPPPDIFPYLETRKSLSTILFWASLSWGLKVLQSALRGDADASALAWRVFGTIPPLKPDRDVFDCIHARLTYRMTGTVSDDHPGNNPELALRLKSSMATTCEANGTPLESFLAPPAIEQSLRYSLGDRYGLVERALHGVGTPEEMEKVRGLVDTMVRSSVCLGDGPRWKTDVAVSLLDEWSAGVDCS